MDTLIKWPSVAHVDVIILVKRTILLTRTSDLQKINYHKDTKLVTISISYHRC